MNYFNNQYQGFMPSYQSIPQGLSSLENQLNNLRNYSQQNFQSHQGNGVNPTNILQRGEFVVVGDIRDVEAIAPPVDGVPLLVFVSGKNVFYNKRYENGSVRCIPNVHSPYNNGEETEEPKKEIPDYAIAINERLDAIENKIDKTKKTKDEVKDEI